jgi:hypothetical protein
LELSVSSLRAVTTWYHQLSLPRKWAKCHDPK